MSDEGDEEKSQLGGDEADEQFNLPELWKCAKLDKVGKIVKYLNTKEEEELPEAVQEANPENGQSLLMWASQKQRFVLVEWLIKKCKRDAFAFRNKTAMSIYDKWVEERKNKADREKEAAEEAAARAAEGEAEEEEEEEKEPEPELSTVVLEGLGEEEGVDIYTVRSIGELGCYEGGRDAQGNKTGLGQSIFVNGDMYIGEYMNNKREGTGTYWWAKEGLIYIGQWKNNQRSGVGRMIHADGGRYYGQWLLDKKNGKGRYTYPNGDAYDGDWQEDKKEGHGCYTFACDQSQYVGTYRNGEFTSGKWVLVGNTTYFGVFKGFKPKGKGVYVFNGKFKQEGEYKAGKWVPTKVQNVKGGDEADLLLQIQGKPVQLRFTPEVGGCHGIEQLVAVANFRPFEDWVGAVESQKAIGITDTRIRCLDMTPAGQIKSVQLQVDAYDLTKPAGERQKLPEDFITLEEPKTLLAIILTHAGKEHYVGVQCPDLAKGDFAHVQLPCGRMDAAGSFKGPEVAKIAEVFQLGLHRHSMMDLTESCFGRSSHPLFTSTKDCNSSFKTWLYKQEVHSDYFNKLADRIRLNNRDGDLCKLVLMEADSFLESVTGTQGSTVLRLLQAMGQREDTIIPLQTVAVQRPPTPPPPAPEPTPVYTEEELAMQQATLDAEAASKKKKKPEGEEEEKPEGEEEED